MIEQPQGRTVYRRAPRERDGQPLAGVVNCPACRLSLPVYGARPAGPLKCPTKKCWGYFTFTPVKDLPAAPPEDQKP